MSAIEAKLSELGIILPEPAAAAGNYVPYVISGRQLYISGQLPFGKDAIEYQGKLGAEFDVAAGVAAAKLCAINILAQAKAACGGDLQRIKRCVRLGGFVNCTADFDQHPAVINGASNLIADVLGEAGRHARAATGSNALPFNAAVEVDAIFELV